MKHLVRLSMALLATVFMFTVSACSSDDDDNSVKSYDLTVSLALPNDIDAANVNNLQLVVTRAGAKADTIALGTAVSDTLTLPQGSYTLAVTGKITNEANGYVSGTASSELYANQAVTISLNRQTRSSLIFKEIFCSGGMMRYMKDGYFEIVNNSDEVQYLDGVILMACGNANTKEQNVWQANGITDRYACGQGPVIAFPASASGKEIPLQPGQSVVVANDAANHSELAGEGNHCPDLSNAPWEVYLDYISDDIDYPNAKNMDVIFTNNQYMKAFGLGFVSLGIIMAKLPAGVTPQQFAADPANLSTTPGTTSTMQYLLIPSKYVLDAVDIWNRTDTEHYLHFLATDDAQGVLDPESWVGNCVRRKVTRVENGRAYFQDTNNSGNDFLTNQPLNPGKVYTEVDK